MRFGNASAQRDKIFIVKGGSNLKKSTKRLISSILTAAMLLTSVTVNPLSAFAADYTQDTLTGLTYETATVDNVKTTTWTFAPPADGADKINAGDTVEGILITGEGSKTWNDSNKFAVSKSMGFSLPISDNCTGGTVAITSTSNNSSRYLYLETDPSVTVPYNTSENTVEFTSANIVDGYLSFINNPTGGDYKMSKIVLVENLSGDSGETTTETPTEEPTEEPTEATTEASTEAPTEAPTEEPTAEPTTEAPTETPTETPTEEPTEAPTEESTVEPTTEAPTETPTEESTEGTTEAPAPSGGYAYIPSVPIASGATAYDDANASIVAMQNLDITANTEGAVTIGDNSYTTNLVSTSTNTQLNVDGSSGNYRVAFSVTAKTDITVKVDVKVGAGKEVYLTAGPVTAGSTCSAIDGRNNVTADIYTTLTADVAAGDTIYFVGKGTNAPVYGVDIIAKGGSTTPTEATTEAPTETTTVAPVETTTEAPTETTTTAPVAGTINIGASIDGVASDAGSQTLAADAVGTTVKVNIDLSGVEATAGYNNYTFFIKYNPSVLKAVSVADPGDLSGYSLANGAVVYDAADIANSISYVPSATNADYTDVNADGTKTAAQLGKIKIANYLDGNSTVATTSGTLVALNFEVVGAGSSDLEIVLVENGIFAAPGANAEITAVASTNTVVVEGEATTETSTSEVPTETSTSEIPTETTTGEVPTETSTSEPITAPEGTLGVGITPNGNVTANVGDTITFNVDVANAEEVPFNNYTFFISYDPNVIEAVQAVNPTNPATVDGTPAYTLVSNLNGVDNSINYKPSATNPDFANLGADGVKTAAQLGKIKIADYVGEDGVTLVNNSGTLMSIQFVVKAEGDTKLTITKVDNGFYGAVGSEIIDVMPINNTITITSGDEPGPEPAPGIAGDVNMDGNITADDASFTLQKTLNNAFELPCQTAYPDTYMLIVDVNNDGNITADDASYILQKTLNNAFDFPIDAVRGE